MQLVRTTIRLNEQLKKFAEQKAFEENTSFQEIVNIALKKYLDDEGKKVAKKVIFKTHHLGKPLDKLTRDDYYQDPQ